MPTVASGLYLPLGRKSSMWFPASHFTAFSSIFEGPVINKQILVKHTWLILTNETSSYWSWNQRNKDEINSQNTLVERPALSLFKKKWRMMSAFQKGYVYDTWSLYVFKSHKAKYTCDITNFVYRYMTIFLKWNITFLRNFKKLFLVIFKNFFY